MILDAIDLKAMREGDALRAAFRSIIARPVRRRVTTRWAGTEKTTHENASGRVPRGLDGVGVVRRK